MLNKFLFRLSIRVLVAKLCDGAQMAIFGDFFASCVFSEPRAAGFRQKENSDSKPGQMELA